MSDQSIFGENQNNLPQGTPANQPTNQPDALATLLASIKNENGEPKYKTVEDAVKALAHSQSFIPTLQSESREKDRIIEELKTKVQKVDTLETTLQQLIERQNTPTKTDVVIDEDKIANIVNNSLTRIQQETVQKQNIQTVTSRLQELFGDKASETFYSKAEQAGLSKQEINALAAKSPAAVFKLLDVESATVKNTGLNQGTVNTTGFKQREDSALGRNKQGVLVGATSKDVVAEAQNARKLVDELHSQGLSVYDLTDPKTYAKLFG